MSHDRGCFKCFEDRDYYEYCKRTDCPKKELVKEWKRREG